MSGTVIQGPTFRVTPQDGSVPPFGIVLETTDYDVLFEVTPIVGALAQLQPRGDEQRIGVRVDVVGIAAETVGFLADELFSWSCERGLTEQGHWSVSFQGRTVNELGQVMEPRFPDPLSYGGVPPGLGTVGLVLYMEPSSRRPFEIQVIGEGRAMSAGRTPGLGDRIDVSGDGHEGFWRSQPIEYTREALHGLTHDEIVREMALAAGVPEGRIALGGHGSPRLNGVTVACASWWPVAASCMASIGRALGWSKEAEPRLITRPLCDTEGPVAWTITTDDIYDGGTLRFDIPEDPATCFVITGSVVADPAADGDGNVTKTFTTRTFETDFVIPSASFRQTSVGPEEPLIELNVLGPTPGETLTEEITKSETTNAAGCLVVSSTVTSRFFAPEVARYDQLTLVEGELETFGSVFIYDEGASAGDTAAAFRWDHHRFTEVAISETRPIYGSDGFLEEKVTKAAAFYAREKATHQETAPDTTIVNRGARMGDGRGVETKWGELYYNGLADPDADVPLHRGSQGPGVSGQVFHAGHWLTVTTETPTQLLPIPSFTGLPTGVKTSEGTVAKGFGPTGSGVYIMADGSTRSAGELEPGRVIGTKENAWGAVGDAGHTEEEGGLDFFGKRLPRKTTEKDGYLPAVDFCDAASSSKKRKQEVRGTCCRNESRLPPKTAVTSNQWIESAEEAEFLACLLAKLAHAPTFTYTGPPNAALEEGDAILFDLGVIGPAYDGLRGWVEMVSLSGEERAITMTVRGRLAP